MHFYTPRSPGLFWFSCFGPTKKQKGEKRLNNKRNSLCLSGQSIVLMIVSFHPPVSSILWFYCFAFLRFFGSFSSKWPKVFCQVIRWIDISIMFYQSQTKSHGINHELPFLFVLHFVLRLMPWEIFGPLVLIPSGASTVLQLLMNISVESWPE